uniref:DNA helicase Pif1-like protein n=1 Tax=Tanacetum cinerariifolium TaxID=118510 RepID=A0A6L2P018_TANCI|nr:DNA helicase Pif1-like protein [Tanacetum cinerariifolium]
MFGMIGFNCLFKISEQIVPRFILEFYNQLRLDYNLKGQILVEFIIPNKLFSFALEEFGQILDNPIEGQCSFSNKLSLDNLEFSVLSSGLYQTTPTSPDDIKLYVQIENEEPLTRSCPSVSLSYALLYCYLHKIQSCILGWKTHGVGHETSSVNYALRFMVRVMEENRIIDEEMKLKRRSKLKLNASRHRLAVSAITRITDVRANANSPLLPSSHSDSFDLQQIAAALEDKLDIRMNRFEKSLNEMKNSFITPTAPLKEVTETAAVGNFIQNFQNVSNQMRPPGFHQPTQQNNNQNHFQGNNLNQNRPHNQGAIYQNRPPQNPNFQAPPQQNTITQGKFEAYTTANDANMNNLQLKFHNFQRNQQDFQKKFEQKQDDFQNQMM